jgi:DNA-binding beta-propeller fold protein YncE
MDRQLRDLLEAAAGEPPHQVSVEAVRRRAARRRVRQAVGIPAAVAVLAAIGVTAATVAFRAVPGPVAVHRPAHTAIYVSYPGKHQFAAELAQISAATNRPGKPIRIGTIGGLAFTPDGKTAYVEGPTGAIIPINTVTNTPGKPIRVATHGYRPFNITMDPDGKTAYVSFGWSIGSSRSGSIVPVNAATNTAGQPIRVYSGYRPYVAGIVFSPGGKTAYVVAGTLGATPPTLLDPATIIPVNTATNRPGRPIRLSQGESDIAISPDGKTIYVDSGGAGGRPSYVTPIDTAARTPGRPIQVSTGATTMTITPDGRTLYVAGSKTITPISTATNTAGQPIHIGNGTNQMVITPDGTTLYAATDGSTGAVIPISTATNTAGRPIRVMAFSIAITPDGKTLYAAAGQGVVPISTATNTPGKIIHPADYRGIPALWITPWTSGP